MPFLFKIIAILIGIFIWKAVVGSFRKASRAMHDDSYDGEEDSAPVAQNDLEQQWRQAAVQLAGVYDPGDDPNAKKASITGRFSGHSIAIKRFGRNYVRYFVAFRKAPDFQVCAVRDLESIAERILDGHPVYPSKMFFPSGEPDFYCSAESEEAFDRFLSTPSNRSAVLNLVRTFPAGMFNNEGVSVRLRATTPDVTVISRGRHRERSGGSERHADARPAGRGEKDSSLCAAVSDSFVRNGRKRGRAAQTLPADPGREISRIEDLKSHAPVRRRGFRSADDRHQDLAGGQTYMQTRHHKKRRRAESGFIRAPGIRTG